MLEKKQRMEMKERRVKIERQMRKKHSKYLPNYVSHSTRRIHSSFNLLSSAIWIFTNFTIIDKTDVFLQTA